MILLPKAVKTIIYTAQTAINCVYPLARSSCGEFEFIPYAIREYGHICPKFFAKNTKPDIPPIKEIATGKAKLFK